MKKLLICIVLFAPLQVWAAGMGADDPLLFYLKADKFEWRDSDEGDLAVWEIDSWIGKDLHKLWISSSGEALDGDVESHELELLYNRALTAFWDLQLGLRHELKPEPTETWVGAGFNGVAPYMLETNASLFINDDSNANLRLEIEYEYMFTQRVELVPILELSIYSDDDSARGIVSGLALVEMGFRLHYQFEREFAPYLGVVYERRKGNSVVESSSETQLVAGVRFWF
jgi:copper resistance protein B